MAIEKNKIKDLLDIKNIFKVLYVDDLFGLSAYESTIEMLAKEKASNTDYWPIKSLPSSTKAAQGRILKWWKDLGTEDKWSFIDEKKIDREHSDFELNLLKVFPDGILEFLSLERFQRLYSSDTIKEDADHQYLILMDQELKTDDGREGITVLQDYKDLNNVQCGLFSQTFDKDQEIDIWKNKCEKSPNIYPLSKKRLDLDEDFIPGLRDVIWLRQISDIKRHYSKIVDRAKADMEEFIKELDPVSFDKIVMEDSKEEGCWEFETLHRIGMMTLNKRLEDRMTGADFAKFQTETNSLRQIKGIAEHALPDALPWAEEYYQMEHFYDGKFINSIYSQISNGDIFEFGHDKKLILFSQPCNLELRKKGIRRVGELVYLVKMNPIQGDPSLMETNKLDGQLKFNGVYYIIKYSNARLTPAYILDLVSYNQEGLAKIDMNVTDADLKEIIQPNLRKRYGKIFNKIKEYKSNIEVVNSQKKGLGGRFKSIIAFFEKPECFGTLIAKPQENGNTIDFGIKRIGRLRDPYAQEYLQEFMAYMCRPAYPMQVK